MTATATQARPTTRAEQIDAANAARVFAPHNSHDVIERADAVRRLRHLMATGERSDELTRLVDFCADWGKFHAMTPRLYHARFLERHGQPVGYPVAHFDGVEYFHGPDGFNPDAL